MEKRNSILKVEGISTYLGKSHVLQGVSLEVEAGEHHPAALLELTPAAPARERAVEGDQIALGELRVGGGAGRGSLGVRHRGHDAPPA